MLIHHKDNGYIDMGQSDPGPEALANLLASDPNYVHIEGVELPPVMIMKADGTPFLDENGQPKVESPGLWYPEVNPLLHRIVIHADGKKELDFRHEIMPPSKTEILADGKDTAVFRRLPDPVTIYVDGKPYEVTGGKLDFVVDSPGTYVVEFKFPCVDATWKIVAK